MPFEMRRPEMPNIEHFINALDGHLRGEVFATRRAAASRGLYSMIHSLRKLAKPLAQSGAMALTALAVIIAIGTTPAARSGDLANLLTTPVATPNHRALVESDRAFLDYLPEEDILAAVQEADTSDTPTLVTE